MIREELEDALEEMERDLSDDRTGDAQTFTWKGVEIPCIPAAQNRSTTPDLEGNSLDIAFSIIVRRVQFLTADDTLTTVDGDLYTVDNQTPIPVSGRTLTFRGEELRIITAKLSPCSSHFTLTLTDPSTNK